MSPKDHVTLLRNSLVSIAKEAPKRAITAARMPAMQYMAADAIGLLGLGDDMKNSNHSNYVPYYYGNPQLFRMPPQFRHPGPPSPAHTTSAYAVSMEGAEQSTLKRATPYIALGIVGIVGYNMFFRKGR